jgi:hypothetical protein
MNNNISIENILILLNKLYDSKFEYIVDISTSEIIKRNQEFSHYFLNGFNDGSGGMNPFMTELCRACKPSHVVELGNREGMGILSIFEGLKDFDG